MKKLVYYNEFDPKAAAWLRELIKLGVIADGDIDERSIADVQPADLAGYRQCHFFAGIGGWSVACRLAGIADDEEVWTGSCPCPPFSSAGKKKVCVKCGGRPFPCPWLTGHFTCSVCDHSWLADARHLWPEFWRLVAVCRPARVYGEQVASDDGRVWLAGIRSTLEQVGYGFRAADTCAAGVGSPQIRQRLYWLGYANEQRWGKGSRQPREVAGTWSGEPEPSLAGSDRGLGSSEGGRPQGRDGEPSHEPRGPRSGLRPDRPSPDSRMADADRDGRGQGGERVGAPGHDGSVRNNGLGGLGDTLFAGLEGQPGHEHDGDKSGRFTSDKARPVAPTGRHGFWSAFDLILLRDGSARRIEPGSFPLAHGVSGRVGLLRGYGNAIVPEQAAQFIQAN